MQSFKTFNPESGAFLDEHSYALPKDISKSLDQLHLGFLDWKKLSFSDRQKILRPVIGLFQLAKDDFIQSIVTEMGKPISMALSEFDKSIQAIEIMCTDSDFNLSRN